MTVKHKFHAPTVPNLAPIGPDHAIADALDILLTDDRDREGRRILAFPLDPKLRSALQVRLHRLQAALVAAQPSDLAETIAQMFLGFSSARASEEDAEAIVTQYVSLHVASTAVGCTAGLPTFRVGKRYQDRMPRLEARLSSHYGSPLPFGREDCAAVLCRRKAHQ